MNRDIASLRDALDRLSMLPRLVYLLHATHEIGLDDIAYCLGMSTRDVEQHLAVALSLLSEALESRR